MRPRHLVRLLPPIAAGLLAALLTTAPLQAQQFQTNGHSFHVAPLPAWINWIAEADLPHKAGPRPGLAVAYRLVDRQVRLTDTGESRFSRLVRQPLTEAGLRQAAQIEINFNPAFQALVIHKLDLVRDGKPYNRLRPDQVRLIQREQDFESKLYDGVVTAVIILDDVRLKDAIDLSYSIEGRNPVFGNKHFSAFALGWIIPVDLARVSVSAPDARKLRYRAFNSDYKPSVQRRHGRVEYQWSVAATPAVVSDEDAPVWYQPFPGIQITEYSRWRDVAGWADTLYSHDRTLPPALLKTLRQWREQDANKKHLAARALKLVQDDVRYFGIELGQNSHRPSLPGDVYERRYGDCKDKASLLIAMLDELGISAYPALVSTDYQRDIDNWLPSPGLFDHVIVTTKLDGKRYWLDATRTYQQGGLDSLGLPDFERALIVRKGENRLTPIEAPQADANGMDIDEQFQIASYTAPVALTVTTTYHGSQAEALREYFATNSPQDISRSYMNYYAKLYPSIAAAAKPIQSRNDPGANRFTTVEHYRIDKFWEADGDGSSAHLVGSTIAPYIRKPDTIRRSAPLAISYPMAIHHRSVLTYPEDVNYRIDEPDTVIEGPFVSYRRHVSYADRRLTVVHDYRARKEAVSPAQLSRYFQDLNKINDNLDYSTQISGMARVNSVSSMVNTLLERIK